MTVVLADVSVLVAATRPDHVHHDIAHSAIGELFRRGEPMGWNTHILCGLVRIISHPKVFPVDPSPVEEAFRAAEGYMRYPHARRLEAGTDHWRIFRDLSLHQGLRGGTLSDAWHAALAIEHGSQWWTLDSDFARFPGLNQRNLLSG